MIEDSESSHETMAMARSGRMVIVRLGFGGSFRSSAIRERLERAGMAPTLQRSNQPSEHIHLELGAGTYRRQRSNPIGRLALYTDEQYQKTRLRSLDRVQEAPIAAARAQPNS